MKLFKLAVIVFSLLFSTIVWGTDGMVELKSPYSSQDTLDRLGSALSEKNMTVFASIDHAEGAKKIDLTLRPTTVVIFGNPQGGTPFMHCAQTVGIDLPLKMLVWEDQDGQVWLGYNKPEYIASRHGVPECAVAQKISNALDGIAAQVVAK